MNGDAFRALRDRIGLTQEALGLAIKAGGDKPLLAVSRWETDSTPIPGPVQVLMQLLADVPEARRAIGIDEAGEKPKTVETMAWTPKSSNVSAVTYDGISTLTVTFARGGSGDYLGVPASVVEAFRKAESPGSFLATHLKGAFEYVRHDPEAKAKEAAEGKAPAAKD